MKEKVLVLYDVEGDYARHMMDFLKTKAELPFEIRTYTELSKLLAFGEKKQIELLLVSEAAYTDEVRELLVGQTIILNESGRVKWNQVTNIDKYQQAEKVYKDIMANYLSGQVAREDNFKSPRSAQLIGLYSPIRRCLQTSFALTLGQNLASRYKVLYLSFEHYAGWNGMLRQEDGADLSDLLCHVEEGEERFRFYLGITEKKFGELYYIPPVYAGENLLYITCGQWKALIEKIQWNGNYDFIIMDLSDSLQGLFEILENCDRIYTLVQKDGYAQGKVGQYEQLLRMYDKEGILYKTRKECLPIFSDIPSQIEQFTKGELSEYIKRIIKEDLEVS